MRHARGNRARKLIMQDTDRTMTTIDERVATMTEYVMAHLSASPAPVVWFVLRDDGVHYFGPITPGERPPHRGISFISVAAARRNAVAAPIVSTPEQVEQRMRARFLGFGITRPYGPQTYREWLSTSLHHITLTPTIVADVLQDLDLLHLLLENPACPSDALTTMVESVKTEVEQAMRAHELSQAQSALRPRHHGPQTYNEWLSRELLRFASLTPEIVAYALESLVESLVMHPACPPEALRIIYERHADLRHDVLRHPACPLDLYPARPPFKFGPESQRWLKRAREVLTAKRHSFTHEAILTHAEFDACVAHYEACRSLPTYRHPCSVPRPERSNGYDVYRVWYEFFEWDYMECESDAPRAA